MLIRYHAREISGRGLERFNGEGEIIRFNITIYRRAVYSKELIYLILLHKLSHCFTTATIAREHKYHGNSYLKVLETLYKSDV